LRKQLQTIEFAEKELEVKSFHPPTKTIDKISEEAIEMILPMNYKKISEDRTMAHTAGNLGFANTSSLGSLTSGGGGPSEAK
jgi:hypothetical protein